MRIRGEKLTFKRISRYTKKALYERAHMLIYKMDIDCTPSSTKNAPDVTIAQIDKEYLDLLMRGKRPSHKMVMLGRLENGDRCFVAKRGDRICGYSWVREHSYYFPEIYYKVNGDQRSIWIYDELIFEEERGKRIQHQILSEIFKWGRKEGYKNVYVGILSDNDPSLKAHSRFGFKNPVKEINMLKVLGIKKHKITVRGDG